MGFGLVHSQMTFDWRVNTGVDGGPTEILTLLVCTVLKVLKMCNTTTSVCFLPKILAHSENDGSQEMVLVTIRSLWLTPLPFSSSKTLQNATQHTILHFQKLFYLCYADSKYFLKGICTYSRRQDLTWLLLIINDTCMKRCQKLYLIVMPIIL